MPEDRFSLFGQPTPEQIRRSIGRTGLETDLAIGSLGPQQALQTAGAMGGRLLTEGIGTLFGGGSRPSDPVTPPPRPPSPSSDNAAFKGIEGARTPDDVFNYQAQNAKRSIDIAQSWNRLPPDQVGLRLEKSKFAWDKVSFQIERAAQQYTSLQSPRAKAGLLKAMDSSIRRELKGFESGTDGSDSPAKLTAGIYNSVIAEKLQQYNASSFDELSSQTIGTAFLLDIARDFKPENMADVYTKLMDPNLAEELADREPLSRKQLLVHDTFGINPNDPGGILEFDE